MIHIEFKQFVQRLMFVCVGKGEKGNKNDKTRAFLTIFLLHCRFVLLISPQRFVISNTSTIVARKMTLSFVKMFIYASVTCLHAHIIMPHYTIVTICWKFIVYV